MRIGSAQCQGYTDTLAGSGNPLSPTFGRVVLISLVNLADP